MSIAPHSASLYRETLEQLAAVDRSALAPAERLFDQILDRLLRLRLEGDRFPSHLLPVRQLGSLVIEFPLTGSGGGIHPFKTVADYDSFLQRIDGFVIWVDSAIANMREGIQRGVVQPRAVIEPTLTQLDAIIVDDPQQSLFYQPIQRMPADVTGAEGARLSHDLSRGDRRKEFCPAYAKLERIYPRRVSAGHEAIHVLGGAARRRSLVRLSSAQPYHHRSDTGRNLSARPR